MSHTSHCSSKRLYPYLIFIHSGGMRTRRRSRTSPEPEQNWTTEGFEHLPPFRRSRPPQASTRNKMARIVTLIFLMDSSLNPLVSCPLSFLHWPILNSVGPSSPATTLRFVTNFLQNLTLLMLRSVDTNGKGLQSCRVSTSMQWSCDDLLHTLLQSSTILTPPEAFVHRFSLTARDTIMVALGPSDAPFPVKSSTAHDAMLIWMDVSFFSPPLPRSVNFILLSQLFDWNFRLFELIDLGHRSSLDSMNLVYNCVQLSRTLCTNHCLLGLEENLVKEYSLLAPISNCLKLDYCCRIVSIHCFIPVYTSCNLKEFHYPFAPTCQSRIQLLISFCLLRNTKHQSNGLIRASADSKSLYKPYSVKIKKPFPTSSFMERTLLWSLHPWTMFSKLRICHVFLVFACAEPVTPKAMDISSTSRNLLIVTKLFLLDLFAEAFPTHHDLACGNLLRSCLRVPMDLSLNFEVYFLCFYLVILIHFNHVTFNHEVDDLVNFSPFWV
ncbi:unnamed protein product [Arabidopsis halleri]